MNAPPKEKRGLQTALETAELKAVYRVLPLFQAPFGFLFWEDRASQESAVRSNHE